MGDASLFLINRNHRQMIFLAIDDVFRYNDVEKERMMKMKSTRIVFFGTADFSKAVLEMLIKEGYNVVACVSQPDRPVGRKKVLQPTLVKQVALDNNIPCLQPENLTKEADAILAYEPELIISAAYGQYVPTKILNAPRLKAINVHASLLPKLRGGAPVHYAILEGHKQTGVTIMYMAKKLDGGDMLAKRTIDIHDDETVGLLYERLTEVGASLLKDTLPDFIEGKITPEKQNEQEATYAPIITREQEHVLFTDTVKNVDLKIRAFNDWPVGYAIYQGQNIKLWFGHPTTKTTKKTPGTILEVTKEGISIACQDGVYCLTELQIPGKKKMLVKDYLNGKSIFEVGTCFE